jgi:hypothetical protein
VYLLGGPRYLLLNVPKTSKVLDVIRHLISLYLRDQALSKEQPLAFSKYPDAYELRLVDEDKANFAPDYSIGALDRRERIGQHDALALV